MFIIKVKIKTVTTREAQHHLAKVLKLVEAGEEVVITRRGEKIARIQGYSDLPKEPLAIPDSAKLRRELGTDRLSGAGENEVINQRGHSSWSSATPAFS